MAWTQAQRDALAAAIATGATSVAQDGGRVEYRSLDEMRALLAQMDRELAPTLARPLVTYARIRVGA